MFTKFQCWRVPYKLFWGIVPRKETQSFKRFRWGRLLLDKTGIDFADIIRFVKTILKKKLM